MFAMVSFGRRLWGGSRIDANREPGSPRGPDREGAGRAGELADLRRELPGLATQPSRSDRRLERETAEGRLGVPARRSRLRAPGDTSRGRRRPLPHRSEEPRVRPRRGYRRKAVALLLPRPREEPRLRAPEPGRRPRPRPRVLRNRG